MIDADTVKQAWLQVFPNSHAYSREIMGSTFVRLMLFKPDECVNKIENNDPLHHVVWIEGDSVRDGDSPSILTKPEPGSFNAYGSVKMRKQTIKNADYNKLVRRFRKIRAMIEAEVDADNVPDDLSSKLVAEDEN